MSQVRRQDFVSQMGPGLDIKALSPEAQAALKKAGIDQAALANIAGQDGVISGKDELESLFLLVDTKDRDGSYGSIETTQKNGQATASGLLYEALKGERERVRLGAPAATPAKASTPTGAPLPNAILRPTEASYQKGVSTLKDKGFTDIHIAKNTPYFNQADADWKDHSYPKVDEKDSQRTLHKSGCAPTALAMADAALRGSGTLPTSVADFAVKTKTSGALDGYGSDTHGLAKAWAEEHDLTYTPATTGDPKKNVDIIRDGLKNGGVALVGVGVDPQTKKGHFTQNGHVMVINGYAKDKDGKEWFFVVNPGRRDATKAPGMLDANVQHEKGLHHGAGQVRISREQLEKELRHGLVLSN